MVIFESPTLARSGACPGVADVRVNTPEGKGQGNQGKKYLDNSLVVANGVKEHGGSPLTHCGH
jgi:hypothetical protein